MKKLMKNKKGFTLMEMLIVIAIIVILVAIAVPTFTSQVQKANVAADDANERAARAQAAVEYLANDLEAGDYKFDAATGKIVDEDATVTAYGKSGRGDVITVSIADDGTITIGWD